MVDAVNRRPTGPATDPTVGGPVSETSTDPTPTMSRAALPVTPEIVHGTGVHDVAGALGGAGDVTLATGRPTEEESEQRAVHAVLSGILGATSAEEVAQELLEALCTHLGWGGATRWRPGSHSPPPVRRARATREIVLGPAGQVLALPLVHGDKVLTVLAPVGDPPVAGPGRVEVLRYLANRTAADLARRTTAPPVVRQTTSVERDLTSLAAAVRQARRSDSTAPVVLETETLQELARHVMHLVARREG